MSPERSGIALFMTHGMSLGRWDADGVLARELAVYERVAPELGGMSVVSYGGPEEDVYADPAMPLHVLPNRHRLPARAYAFAAPLLHRGALSRAAVFKTNQAPGGLVALRAARLQRRPLVARCGYLWSDFEEADHGAGSVRARLARSYERRLFRGADAVVVTTASVKETICERYGIAPDDVRVIPNFVPDHLFDAPREPVPGSLLFVGRLREQKNLDSLIEAVAGLEGAALTIAGDGPLRGVLEARANALGANVRFAGTVPHAELPELMARSAVFALPSHYEGHPKALIEAMAAGMPVVGAATPGIREVLDDGESGLLCGTDRGAIRSALERMLSDDQLRERLGHGARRAAAAYSVASVAELELDLLRSVADL